MRSALVAVAVLVMCSCSDSRDAATADSDALAEAAIADTLGCGLIAHHQHLDADSLVAEFLRRDAAGEFQYPSAWFDGAVTCPGHEPGPDVVTIARGYSMRPLRRTADSLVVEVVWNRVGYGGFGADAIDPGTDYDTLAVARTPFGWRMISPALKPHLIIPPPPR